LKQYHSVVVAVVLNVSVVVVEMKVMFDHNRNVAEREEHPVPERIRRTIMTMKMILVIAHVWKVVVELRSMRWNTSNGRMNLENRVQNCELPY
jgi:hypothetical protein